MVHLVHHVYGVDAPDTKKHNKTLNQRQITTALTSRKQNYSTL